MTRHLCWLRPALLTLLVLVLLVASSPARTLAQGQGQPVDGWVSLGPDMPIEAYGLGVSSRWPDDPFIIARLAAPPSEPNGARKYAVPGAVRTFDGGKTWEPIESLPRSAYRLVVISSGDQQRVIFALPGGRSFENGERGRPRYVFRSFDNGATWEQLHAADNTVTMIGERAPQLVVSPAVIDDGRLYLLDDARLFETADLGQTWTQRELTSGQHVENIEFSPDFARDRTLFASVVTEAPVHRPMGPHNTTEHVDSVGIMVSHDAGVTWTAVSDGLQIGSAPYRQVQALAISPAYGQDHTIFAYAWGPTELFDGGAAKWKQTALFKSSDGGAHWDVIWQPEYRPQPRPGSYVPSFFLSILPSSDYAHDGTIALAVRTASVTTTPRYCQLLLSRDRGLNWNRMRFDRPNCVGTTLLPGAQPTVVYSGRLNDSDAYQSVFASTTESTSTLIRSNILQYAVEESDPIVGGDGSILFGTTQGVWMLPPDAPVPMSRP